MDRLPLLALALFTLLLAGCATSATMRQKRLEANPEIYADLSEEERSLVSQGRLREGMSKEAVLLARGYPPVHHTPSTAANTWTYWVGRFEKRRIEFEQGRVVRIVD